MLRAPNDRGFSLIEALVALAVFAMAGVGLVQLQTHSLQTLSQVETRALADIVAQNALVEIVAGDVPPAPGERTANEHFAGRDWQVVTQVVPVGGMLRVSVAVSASASTSVTRAHAFVSAEAS